MGERDIQEAGITEMRQRRARPQREQAAPPPTPPAPRRKTAPGEEGKRSKARPDEPVEHDVRRRKAGRNAVARRDEAHGPEQGGAGAAGEARDDLGGARGCESRLGGRLQVAASGYGARDKYQARRCTCMHSRPSQWVELEWVPSTQSASASCSARCWCCRESCRASLRCGLGRRCCWYSCFWECW